VQPPEDVRDTEPMTPPPDSDPEEPPAPAKKVFTFSRIDENEIESVCHSFFESELQWVFVDVEVVTRLSVFPR
jgi:hypothetical protein